MCSQRTCVRSCEALIYSWWLPPVLALVQAVVVAVVVVLTGIATQVWWGLLRRPLQHLTTVHWFTRRNQALVTNSFTKATFSCAAWTTLEQSSVKLWTPSIYDAGRPTDWYWTWPKLHHSRYEHLVLDTVPHQTTLSIKASRGGRWSGCCFAGIIWVDEHALLLMLLFLPFKF